MHTQPPCCANAALTCALILMLLSPAQADTEQRHGGAPATNAFAQPVDPRELAGFRGGSQNVHNDMTLTGTTADNSAYQVTTGSNAISTGSFANMAGIPVVIQNTGANVLIQNAVILHLQMN